MNEKVSAAEQIRKELHGCAPSAGTARAEDPLGQVIFLTKLAGPCPRQAATGKRFVRINNKP